MGNQATHVLSDAFAPLHGLDLEAAKKLSERYKLLDMDFGLDQASLEVLLHLPSESGGDLVKALGAGTATVNALDLIAGLVACIPATVDEKLSVIFDAFDFDHSGFLTKDELTIMIMSTFNGLALMSGKAEELDEDIPGRLADEAYDTLDKDASKSVTEEQVRLFVHSLLKSEGRDDVDLVKFVNAFGGTLTA